MLILVLVLVLKDSLRTFFKSLPLSWSRGVTSFPWALVQGSLMGPVFAFKAFNHVFLQYSKKINVMALIYYGLLLYGLLRPRAHVYELPDKDDHNFIKRLLYKNIY